MGLAPAPHSEPPPNAAAMAAEERKQRVMARIAAMEGRAAEFGSQPPPSGNPAAPIEEETYIGMPASSEDETYFGPGPRPGAAPAAQGGPGRSKPPIDRATDGERTELFVGSIVPQQRPREIRDVRELGSERTVAVASPWKPAQVMDAEVSEPAPNTARMLRAQAQAQQMHQQGPQPAPPQQAPHQMPQQYSHPPQHAPQPQVIVPQTPGTALAVRPYEPGRELGSRRPTAHALSGPLDRRLVLLNEPHSTRAASFRVLRDNLLTKSMPRVVAVTSAAPNDGKTTCAANLSLALAEQPQTRVLLVDANFFSTDLSKVFTIDRLGSASPPEAAAWLAPYKVVEVMPSLHVAGLPASAGKVHFEQHKFDALIDHLLRIAYDFVVIDTPALRGTPLVTQLLSSADGALLVVRSGGTTSRDLRRAVEQLPPNKALGVALMDS